MRKIRTTWAIERPSKPYARIYEMGYDPNAPDTIQEVVDQAQVHAMIQEAVGRALAKRKASGGVWSFRATMQADGSIKITRLRKVDAKDPPTD